MQERERVRRKNREGGSSNSIGERSFGYIFNHLKTILFS